MLPVIEKLLILQDRDKRLARVRTELDHIDPERRALQAKSLDAQAALDASKLRLKQIETERKKLELDVETKKQQIDKYSLQQFQTKKNDEYRALAHEIELCKEAITKLDDQQIELMEQAERIQAEVNQVAQQSKETQNQVQLGLSALADKEVALKRQLEQLEADYRQLEEAVEEDVRTRYERIRKQKGGTSVVGIERSVCGGCHMKLPTQIVISCQRQQELVPCPNCGRILYYSRDMDLAVVD